MGSARAAAETDAVVSRPARDGEPVAGGDDRAGTVGAGATGERADDDAGAGGAGGGGISLYSEGKVGRDLAYVLGVVMITLQASDSGMFSVSVFFSRLANSITVCFVDLSYHFQ